MAVGPVAEGIDRDEEVLAGGCQRVLDAGRGFGVPVALDEAVGLESAEGLGEDLLADAADASTELYRAGGSVAEGVEDNHGPAAADEFYGDSGLTV